MKITIKIFLLTIFIFQFYCSKNKSPLDSRITNSIPHTDTLTVHITPGIYMKLESFKDSYSLNEYVNGYLTLVNESDSNGIFISISNWPPLITYSVFDEDHNCLYKYPIVMGGAAYDDTIKIGESLTEKIVWFQYIYSSAKVFSGWYKIEANFRGHRLFYLNPVSKWVQITEEGIPLSALCIKDYKIKDSLKVNFVVTNRISKDLEYFVREDKQIEINFTHYFYTKDTVLTIYDNYPSNKIYFPNYSNQSLYKFEKSKQDSLFARLNGVYNMYITFHFRYFDISSFCRVQFLK